LDSIAIQYGNRGLIESMTEPLDIFLNSVGSQETRRQYKRKVEQFLGTIELEGSLSEKAKQFVEKARKDKDWAFDKAVRFVAYQKMRCDNKQITPGTLRNYYKPIKIFCDTNDIEINWKRITRGFPITSVLDCRKLFSYLHQ
jgi:hypothetical protein